MNIFSKAVLATAIAVVLPGCGSKVEVPPAHVGKIMTKNGYNEGVVQTSKFRLEFCTVYCDKLVTLDVSDRAVTEQMSLFVPQDKLNMAFEIKLTLAVNPDKFDEIYTLIPPSANETDSSSMASIAWSRVYDTYAKNIIIAEVREILSEYSIAEIASSREAINQRIQTELSESIRKRTPFVVRYAGIADVDYPPIIIQAQENAAERREMIQQEEAQLEISKVQLERQLQEEKMKRAIEVEKAKADAEVNRILADSMNENYVQYRSLSILEKMAESNNKVFIPATMLDTVAGQVQLGNQ